jgi:hypothetical protein
MHDFIELFTAWSTDVQKMEQRTLVQLMKMGARVQKLLEMKDKLRVVK